MSDAKRCVPVFIPSLSALLIAAEDKKGSPLTETEVIRIRDKSPCMMVEEEDVSKLIESRGYRDIDPENCWHDWQMLRRELGREPELPAGPQFFHVADDDVEFQRSIEQARTSVAEFRRLMADLQSSQATPMIKIAISDGDHRAFMWLTNVTETDAVFSGELFEAPSEFKQYSVGDRVMALEGEILDWMVNDNGRLHGGFSLRCQRSRMSRADQKEFDEYIGAKEYVPPEIE